MINLDDVEILFESVTGNGGGGGGASALPYSHYPSTTGADVLHRQGITGLGVTLAVIDSAGTAAISDHGTRSRADRGAPTMSINVWVPQE